jgi:hypothetical protein
MPVWLALLLVCNFQLRDTATADRGSADGRAAGASMKSSNTAVSSKFGKGVSIAELSIGRHVHAVDGVSLISVGEGFKWDATSACLRKSTIGFQKDSGWDFQGSMEGSTWSRVIGGVEL